MQSPMNANIDTPFARAFHKANQMHLRMFLPEFFKGGDDFEWVG